MPERDDRSFFLLACFAEFYEAVADLKLAIQEGRLPLLLRNGDEPAPTESDAIAGMVSGQLAGLLRKQAARVERDCPHAVVRAYRIAAYAMAALADEIFVLELDWIGRDAWLDTLLEYKLFKSRTAGRQVFEIAQRLLGLTVRNTLHHDLGAVLLMVFQLGFRGQYRGGEGDAALRDLRTRLFAMLHHQDEADAALKLAFPQAYQHLVTSAPTRLAPLRPWYIAAGIVLVIYLIVSTVVWVELTAPFLEVIGKG